MVYAHCTHIAHAFASQLSKKDLQRSWPQLPELELDIIPSRAGQCPW